MIIPLIVCPPRSHHSLTQPSRYIKLRIDPTIDFYTRRMPIYTRHTLILKVTILMLGVIASVLARYELLSWVTSVTAAATVMTSWAEFGDARSKVARYSSAINALQNLLSTWDSLSEVQKASKASIANLVLTAEAIICEEQASWTSTAAKQAAANQGEAKEGSSKENQKAGASLGN